MKKTTTTAEQRREEEEFRRAEEEAVLAWLVKERDRWLEHCGRTDPTWTPAAVRHGVPYVRYRAPTVLARLARRGGKLTKVPGGYRLKRRTA